MYQVHKFLLTSERESYEILTALRSGGKVQGENCDLCAAVNSVVGIASE